MSSFARFSTLVAVLSCILAQVASAQRLQFGGSAPTPTPLFPSQYSQETGYGFVFSQSVIATETPFGDGVRIDGPAVFAAKVPEGSFRVSVTFAPSANPTPITIKSEARRLHVLNAIPSRGEPTTYTFTAHTRQIQLADGGSVKLKPREIGGWHWNDRLEIEINTQFATLLSIQIEPANELPVLYILGDSTLTDQREEPWTGWGQILPQFLDTGIVVANYAESGLAFSSFNAQRRLDKILETIKPGDFALIQFGHNDQKEKGDGIGPWQSYTSYIHEFVSKIRARGGNPILVTPMKRRRFDNGGRQYETLGDFPLAVRKAAADLGVPLIDLNIMSGVLYAAFGPEDSKKLFVHYPANTFPGQDKPLADDTHFNPYGGYELARCVAEALKLASPALARHLKPDLPIFDPAYPDPIETVQIPPSPVSSSEKPDGN